MDGACPTSRRHHAHASAKTHRDRDQRQRHPQHSQHRDAGEFCRQNSSLQSIRRRQAMGRPVVVFGTGTSAHDICQELHAHGAEVTMVQRSPTMVVNVDPSAQLYDQSYLGEGPPIDIRDILNSGIPLAVIKASHKLITNEVKKLDATLLQGLEKVGFRLEFGEDGTGWPLKFRTRGGGYYFNVGCSELIADQKIRLIQATDIKRFTADGLELGDGPTLRAD